MKNLNGTLNMRRKQKTILRVIDRAPGLDAKFSIKSDLSLFCPKTRIAMKASAPYANTSMKIEMRLALDIRSFERSCSSAYPGRTRNYWTNE